MIENHEILCPSFLDCPLCQSNREELNKSKILNLFGIEDDIYILSKHFYHLTISLTPTRETYHRFSLESFKKVGRELLNGLSSISSVSNRKWWGMFVESGVRYYSIEQENSNEYPRFNQHFIFYSQKDNLDSRMDTQLKCRLRKINKHFNYSFEYLGQYDMKKIQDSIKLSVSVDYSSSPIMKLGEEVREEIYKIKGQRPIVFGGKYHKKTNNKLEIISS